MLRPFRRKRERGGYCWIRKRNKRTIAMQYLLGEQRGKEGHDDNIGFTKMTHH